MEITFFLPYNICGDRMGQQAGIYVIMIAQRSRGINHFSKNIHRKYGKMCEAQSPLPAA
jgi:hypothetical protein